MNSFVGSMGFLWFFVVRARLCSVTLGWILIYFVDKCQWPRMCAIWILISCSSFRMFDIQMGTLLFIYYWKSLCCNLILVYLLFWISVTLPHHFLIYWSCPVKYTFDMNEFATYPLFPSHCSANRNNPVQSMWRQVVRRPLRRDHMRGLQGLL